MTTTGANKALDACSSAFKVWTETAVAIAELNRVYAEHGTEADHVRARGAGVSVPVRAHTRAREKRVAVNVVDPATLRADGDRR
jgi:hypothetical protein